MAAPKTLGRVFTGLAWICTALSALFIAGSRPAPARAHKPKSILVALPLGERRTPIAVDQMIGAVAALRDARRGDTEIVAIEPREIVDADGDPSHVHHLFDGAPPALILGPPQSHELRLKLASVVPSDATFFIVDATMSDRDRSPSTELRPRFGVADNTSVAKALVRALGTPLPTRLEIDAAPGDRYVADLESCLGDQLGVELTPPPAVPQGHDHGARRLLRRDDKYSVVEEAAWRSAGARTDCAQVYLGKPAWFLGELRPEIRCHLVVLSEALTVPEVLRATRFRMSDADVRGVIPDARAEGSANLPKGTGQWGTVAYRVVQKVLASEPPREIGFTDLELGDGNGN